jgi:dipeptidyl-peptidase-4
MRTPEENPEGYDGWAPTHAVAGLKGHYLLVHGSADDNVHVQNTMELVRELVDSGKDFDYFVYPDKNHGIGGRSTRLHLFNMMTEFVLENL